MDGPVKHWTSNFLFVTESQRCFDDDHDDSISPKHVFIFVAMMTKVP